MSLTDEGLGDFTGACPHCLEPCDEELREGDIDLLIVSCPRCRIGSQVPLMGVDRARARHLASQSIRRQRPKDKPV